MEILKYGIAFYGKEYLVLIMPDGGPLLNKKTHIIAEKPHHSRNSVLHENASPYHSEIPGPPLPAQLPEKYSGSPSVPTGI